MTRVRRNRRTLIKFDVYQFNVTVILSHNLAATGSRLGADLCAGDIAAFIPGDPKTPKRTWIVFNLEPDEATVAHEASHVVRYMLKYAGARADNEAFAYHLDYLVGRIHKFLKKGVRG